MIDIDNITDFLFERTTAILDKAGFYFVDDDDDDAAIDIIKTFTLHNNIHNNINHQQIPLCKVTSFLFQNTTNLKQRKLIQVQVEGPYEVMDTCFLNKTPHQHQVWYIIITCPL